MNNTENTSHWIEKSEELESFAFKLIMTGDHHYTFMDIIVTYGVNCAALQQIISS